MHTRILFSFLKQRFLLIGHALWGLSPFAGIPHPKWAYTERIPFQGQWASFTQYVTLISTWSMAHKISCDASWKSSSPSPKWFLSSRFLNRKQLQIAYLFVSGNLRRLRVNYGNYWKRDHPESNQANNFKISLAPRIQPVLGLKHDLSLNCANRLQHLWLRIVIETVFTYSG